MLFNSSCQTYPIVAHFPGGKPDSPFWDKLVKSFLDTPPRQMGLIPDLTIITWNNGKKGILEKSLEHLGIPCTVLGQNIDKWENVLKLELTCGALEEIRTEYVMGIDSYDAILMDAPDVQKLNSDLLFNAEVMCFPEDSLAKDFEKQVGKDYRHRHLNAGAWIGKTQFCKVFFSECMKALVEPRWSEQAQVKATFPKFYPNVQLDYQCEIFQVIHKLSQYDGLVNL